MSKPDMLYDGLPKEVGNSYRKGAIEKYGKEMVEHAEQELTKMGKDGFKQLQADFEAVTRQLFALRNEAPGSEEVQQLITRHYKMIRQFWGTSQKKDPQLEAYAGLGGLYVSDERFTMVDGEPQPEFALFLQKAMRFFADERTV